MSTTKISNMGNKTIYWAVRGFAILFVLFTSMFALDVKPFSWIALLMHLLPTIILLVVLMISWFKEKIGGLLWILTGLAYIVIAWGDVDFLAYLVMAGPAFVIGIVFLWPKKNMNNSLMSNSAMKIKPVSSNDKMPDIR